ncbi:MAG: glycosyltransferase family 4 protein [Candidatus Woesearchaeota archaeon]
MKILMVHPHDIYSTKEPWTVRITEIAQKLTEKGHEVKLVYFPLPEQERGLLNNYRFNFEVIPFKRRKWAIFKNIYKMYKLARWADVIHFQKCFTIASLPAIFAAYFAGKPVHYDWDDWEYQIYLFSPPSQLYGKYLNLVERTIPKLVDTVSVASDGIKNLALSLGVREERIFDAHVGADLNKFNPKIDGSEIRDKYKIKHNTPVVIYLGQLHGAQYAELFVRAAKKLIDEKTDAAFMIVGWGTEAHKLTSLAEKLEISDRIIFTGYVTHEEVPKYLAASDIAVACFEDNGITRCKSPLKIVEYLAAGKAIVASDVGEVKKMVGNAGILVKAGDVEALSKGIKILLNDEKMRKTLGKEARKRAELEYNWDVTTDNLIKAYETAMSLRKH